MRRIDKIILHCSASGDVSTGTIRNWHLARRFNDIGYHYVVRQNGNVEVGRPIGIVGAHCKGFNHESIGICITGGRGGVIDYSTVQLASARLLISGLRYEYGIGQIDVYGHNDFTTAKTCPNFNVSEWLATGDTVAR